MAEQWIEQLNLSPHPLCVGTWFVETYRSSLKVKPLHDESNREERDAMSIIYCLIEKDNVNPWHRVKSDETFYWHHGSPMNVYVLHKDGQLEQKVVGNPMDCPGAVLNFVVPRNVWFAADLVDKDNYNLCSISVAPGFHLSDFENIDGGKLAEQFPQHKELIHRLSLS